MMVDRFKYEVAEDLKLLESDVVIARYNDYAHEFIAAYLQYQNAFNLSDDMSLLECLDEVKDDILEVYQLYRNEYDRRFPPKVNGSVKDD